MADRDKLWTSTFWKHLTSRISTTMHLSTAYHPEGDRRSERTNRTVGQILRTFTAKRQTRWLESLPLTELAINLAVNAATGLSPLNLVLGREPKLFPLPTTSPQNKADPWLGRQEAEWNRAQDALWASRVRQSVQHNKHRMGTTRINEGDCILLNCLAWSARQVGGTSKLRPRWEGPYIVAATFNGGNNAQLVLPPSDNRHNVFHISKLKEYHDPA